MAQELANELTLAVLVAAGVLAVRQVVTAGSVG